MKLHKPTALALLALTGTLAWALQPTGSPDEKVKTPVAASSKTAKHRYPKLRAEGSADGAPYGLSLLSVDDKNVQISWLSPEPTDGYFEDFESHADFEINSAGSIGWTYIDGDNVNTYTWSAVTFPNQGEKMAYIVMNPSKTSPSAESNTEYVPTSGSKMLVDFAAVDAVNNDYIISPELSFDRDFHISFNARSYKGASDNYNLERIRVGYSTTGRRASDFTWVSADPYEEVEAAWNLYEYDIPKEAKYVTINCVSDNAFMLMIDDIFIGTNDVRPGIMPRRASAVNPVEGFNVYRDGVKVNTELVTSIRYTDTVEDYGDYSYTVTAVHKDGSESAQSQPLQVNVPDIHLLPFEDSFDDWTINADKWTRTSVNPDHYNYWRVDYYEYGLVDPCATYAYSSLTDYDQALESTELHTLNQSTTYLRFDLKLRNSEQNSVDYLSVETSCDGGATWTDVKTFDNSKGAMDWTTYTLPLADFLTSDHFQIRFRAHGESASWINYWYVDDIKVWNPVWASATLNVTSSDGPIANAPVKLEADHGSVINDTTDANGQIALPQVEEGTYSVTIFRDGYNYYKQDWAIVSGQVNVLDARLTRPVSSVSVNDITADMEAESKTTKTFTLSNTGDGPMTWHLNQLPTKASGDAASLWEIQGSFKASGDLQQSVVFDGEYYYTTSSIELGKFWKYSKDGQLIEQFTIPEMYYKLYDLTYDGRYFYGSDYSNRLFKLDFENRRIAGIITVSGASDMKITHCSWDPDRKGFWVGSFGTVVFIKPDGSLGSLVKKFDESGSVSVYGSAYDNVTPGGPYLWLADMTAENDYTIDKLQIRQFKLSTRTLTDVKHVLTDAPGYVMGSSSTGENYVCGLFSSPDITEGKLTLIGTLNQSPNLIFKYTLCDIDTWLSLTPRHGTLAAGESQDVTVGFDALKAKKGDTFSSAGALLTLPETTDHALTFTLNATGDAAAPRPVHLTATPGTAKVELAWEDGSTTAVPQGYNVYRDGQKVNAALIGSRTYTDTPLTYGTYIYKVEAVYGNGKTSEQSDSVSAFVKDGAQFYPPTDLTAQISRNKNVALTWQSPTAAAGHRDTLSWASGIHEDQIGIANGGVYYAGVQFDADDIVPYRNKKVESVGVQFVAPVTYLSLSVYEDSTCIYRERYSGTIVYDGSFTQVPLSQDVTLKPGYSYRFIFQLMHDSGVQPLSIDDQKAENGKGNLISVDGTEWLTCAQMGIEGNFNIQVNVAPNVSVEETAPEGYNVYRDGTKVNAETVTTTTYADELTAPGTHTYTVSSVYAEGESAQSSAASVEVYEVSDPVAPREIAAQVERNRNVSVRWSYPTATEPTFKADLAKRPVTTDEDYPEYVLSFRGRKSEMAVATDGRYVYTSVYNEDGLIDKYTLGGEFVQSYQIDGLEGIRNLAFDGEYLYAGDNTTSIHKLDPETMTLIESINISEYSRHLAYIPTLDGGKGGFEVGDWQTSIYISKNGSKLGTGPTLLGAAGTACYDGRIYAFEQGNEANSHTIGVYDMASNQRVGSLDMGAYEEIADISSASAGGMSTFTGADGITYLLLTLQRQGENAQYVVLDLSGIKMVDGYNIYRSGEKLNAEPLARRYFAETLTQPGTYRYTAQTVYLDGTVSEQSTDEAVVTIVETGEAQPPVNLKAVQSTYGYNVLLSYAAPDMNKGAMSVNSFDTTSDETEVFKVSGETYQSNWKVSGNYAFDGTKSILAQKGDAAFGVLATDGAKVLRVMARNADDHDGNGMLRVYTTTHDTNREDFILLESKTTSEQWQQFDVNLPDGTTYVAIAKDADAPATYVDAVALFPSEPESTVYGYDIYRDGVKITDEPVAGISYVDRNLLPAHYDYQVRLITQTAAESELSDAVGIDLSYDNGGLAPTNLTGYDAADGTTRLSWQFPALGEPIYLRWHDGNAYDAAGLSSGGAFFAGVRWMASDLKNYGHLALSDVEVYVNQIPEALFLLVYENNTLVRQQFVPTLTQYAFNTIHLDEPLQIDPTKDLRVAVYVEHNEITVPLGYDKGPAMNGRGDLYSSDGTSWTTMEESGTDIDANWCISIGLSPYSNALPGTQANALKSARRFVPKATAGAKLVATPAKVTASSSKNVFEGYYVYRNGDRLNAETITDTTYVDADHDTSKYREYQVSACYSQSGEKFSERLLLVTSGMTNVEAAGATVAVENGQLVVRGAHAGDAVSVYSAAGALIWQGVIGESYVTVLPAGHFPQGTCLVKVGEQTVKVQIP